MNTEIIISLEKDEWIKRHPFIQACIDKGWTVQPGRTSYIQKSIVCRSNLFADDIVFFSYPYLGEKELEKIIPAINSGRMPVDDFMSRIKDSDPHIVRLMLFYIDEFSE